LKANLQDQKSLLELAQLDIDLVRNSSEKAKLLASTEIEAASSLALSLSDQLIDARNLVGDLELELKRSENDLELVETRISKDRDRLQTTSSAKDAQGIEHELTSLAKRKSELEDLELAVMEQLEKVRAELESATKSKQSAEKDLSSLRQTLATNITELDSERARLIGNREKLIATLDPELAVVYQRKAERGSSVGRLVGRECGACRLSITATKLDEILALASDQVAECPNCQAFLVRS
jgi:predicted  nucleic acid-binding Zn-ribbon protein